MLISKISLGISVSEHLEPCLTLRYPRHSVLLFVKKKFITINITFYG